jgi:hypothetical protein
MTGTCFRAERRAPKLTKALHATLHIPPLGLRHAAPLCPQVPMLQENTQNGMLVTSVQGKMNFFLSHAVAQQHRKGLDKSATAIGGGPCAGALPPLDGTITFQEGMLSSLSGSVGQPILKPPSYGAAGSSFRATFFLQLCVLTMLQLFVEANSGLGIGYPCCLAGYTPFRANACQAMYGPSALSADGFCCDWNSDGCCDNSCATTHSNGCTYKPLVGTCKCPAGNFDSGSAEIICTPCNPGTYSNITGATSSATCIPCAAGTFSAAGSSNCTFCSAGSYSLAGASSCTFPTVTPTTTVTVTPSPTASGTPTPSLSSSGTPTPSLSSTPSLTQTPSGTLTPSLSGTPLLTQTPSGTLTPSLSGTPTLSTSQTVTPSSSLSSTLSASGTQSLSVTGTATAPAALSGPLQSDQAQPTHFFNTFPGGFAVGVASAALLFCLGFMAWRTAQHKQKNKHPKVISSQPQVVLFSPSAIFTPTNLSEDNKLED